MQRCVFLEGPSRAGRHVADPVDHFHALHDLAEHRVAPARLDWDRAPRCRRDSRRTGHRRRADPRCAPCPRCRAGCVKPLPDSLTTLAGAGFGFVVGVEAAALDHEIRRPRGEKSCRSSGPDRHISRKCATVSGARSAFNSIVKFPSDVDHLHLRSQRRQLPLVGLRRFGRRSRAANRSDGHRQAASRRSPASSSSCFMLRDSTRIGTILRYVRIKSAARRHAFCAQSHRLLAPRQCADGVFQPPLGAQKRRAVHFAHRRHGCRAQPASVPRRLDDGSALAGIGVGRGARCGRSVGPLFAGGARRILSRLCSRDWRRTATAYPCYCTAEELELSRKLQRMAGKPPRYAGTCRHLTPRAARRAARRAACGRRCDSRCRPAA